MGKKKKKIDKFLVFGILFHVVILTSCTASFIDTVIENEEERKKIIKQEEELQEKIEANRVNKGYRRNSETTYSPDRSSYEFVPESNRDSDKFIDKKVAIKSSIINNIASDDYGNLKFTVNYSSLFSSLYSTSMPCFWYNDSNADTIRLKKDIKNAQSNGNDIIIYGVYQENPKEIGEYNIYVHDIEIIEKDDEDIDNENNNAANINEVVNLDGYINRYDLENNLGKYITYSGYALGCFEYSNRSVLEFGVFLPGEILGASNKSIKVEVKYRNSEDSKAIREMVEKSSVGFGKIKIKGLLEKNNTENNTDSYTLDYMVTLNGIEDMSLIP